MSTAGSGTCRDCRKPVLFVRLASGSSMPVDPRPDDEGTVAVMRDATTHYVGRVLKAGEQPDAWERRHITHFATCRVKLQREAHKAALRTANTAAAEQGAAPVVSLLDRLPHGRR